MRSNGRHLPYNAAELTEVDLDLLDGNAIRDAEEHVKKLRGIIPCSMDEVKPPHSAAIILSLLRIIERIRRDKTAARARELEREIKGQRRELVRLWKIESKYEVRQERRVKLPPGLNKPA